MTLAFNRVLIQDAWVTQQSEDNLPLFMR